MDDYEGVYRVNITGIYYTDGTAAELNYKVDFFDVNAVSSAVPGDMNSDSQVNNEDVVALLWHTLFPEEYPLSVSGDLNKDSVADNNDVTLLLWHTLFPEENPL